ncbi:MAG: right-handed parallel beta-helix repeat-containing protein [Deltaproteobacteria bacterium]|nr:right-handed parallel beta-helix repeat-containing protein [Deltaproteobacteria bacterium]
MYKLVRKCFIYIAINSLACVNTNSIAPKIDSIVPNNCEIGQEVEITINGKFYYQTFVSFDNKDNSKISTNFSVWIGEIELTQVYYKNYNTLTAIVPAFLNEGTYDITVIDPDGRIAILKSSFDVVSNISTCIDDDEDGFCISQDCDDNPSKCGVNCNPEQLEICDSFDNDCDETTNDGIEDIRVAAACDGDDDDLCKEGIFVCINGAIVCNDNTGTTVEGPNGDQTCSDSIDNDCDGFTDNEDIKCSGINTPPVAKIILSKPIINTGELITFDANTSWDREQQTIFLLVRWDFENDGIWDTGFSLNKSVSNFYDTTGTKTVALQVRDSGNLSGYTTSEFVVASEDQTISVTTGVDEQDAGATLQNPGGTGLSLREAINIANNRVGRDVIKFAPLLLVALTSQLPKLADNEGTVIIGQNETTIDCKAVNDADCIEIGSSNNMLSWLEIKNSIGNAILITSGDNSSITYCSINNNTHGITAMKGTNINIGPGNEIKNNIVNGLRLNTPVIAINNSIYGNNQGIAVGKAGGLVTILGNLIHSNNGNGIYVQNTDGHTILWHNTIVANGLAGLSSHKNVAEIDARNNIFSYQNTYGIEANDVNFAILNYNNYYENINGACSECTTGTNANYSIPYYINIIEKDFRLVANSNLINAGFDLSIDRNGPETGNYNGAAPDIGNWEAP